jgi:hypothetical protein
MVIKTPPSKTCWEWLNWRLPWIPAWMSASRCRLHVFGRSGGRHVPSETSAINSLIAHSPPSHSQHLLLSHGVRVSTVGGTIICDATKRKISKNFLGLHWDLDLDERSSLAVRSTPTVSEALSS